MKLVIGLGNVGEEYKKTRHNVGFLVLDEIARKYNFKFTQNKFGGKYEKIKINNKEVIFLKPQLFVNLSGIVLKRYLDFFKIPVKNILVISDDLDLPLGQYRLKLCGGTGGHKGLRNIEENLNTNNYKRLRIGISNNRKIPASSYVLSNFKDNENEQIKETVKKALVIVTDFITTDFLTLMNLYNRKNKE